METKVCSKCGLDKPLDQYGKQRVGQKYEYTNNYCHTCRRKQIYDTLNTNVRSNLKDRYSRLRRRAKAADIPFSITFDEFVAQFESQGGKCFYFDVDMDWTLGSKGKVIESSLSIDKLIPGLGYVPGNVVFCTHRANGIKANLTLDELADLIPKWHAKIERFLSDRQREVDSTA